MINIELLKQHQTDVPILAKLWHELLGKIWAPDVSIERVEQKFYEHCNEDKLPLAFVARENGQPIGMCALRENDGIRPDLTPWLGSLMGFFAGRYGISQNTLQFSLNRTSYKQ